MEYTEGTLKDTTENNQPAIHPYEYDQASKSYLMAVVAVIAGLPLPIINLFAAIGYYLTQRKAAYFVRWHCIQSILGQIALVPFNSAALAWTIGIMLRNEPDYYGMGMDEAAIVNNFTETSAPYWLYIAFILLLNFTEFIVVIVTASRVKRGHNVRWFGIAPIADAICSKEDRNLYRL